ncbi:MAG TPA: hypothetical protein VFE89_00960 [Beijerinckiaceae bacterium]|nr:hypothetical protein [Beijerinckiaceae bacterium]
MQLKTFPTRRRTPLVEVNYETLRSATTQEALSGIERALRILLPQLTGNIAADVADLLDNPDAPTTERMAWIG